MTPDRLARHIESAIATPHPGASIVVELGRSSLGADEILLTVQFRGERYIVSRADLDLALDDLDLLIEQFEDDLHNLTLG